MNRLRTAAVVFGFFVLHITVFAFVHPFGVAPDVMLLAALLGGLAGGQDFGARHGFLCGLLVDLMAPGPFGLAAGIYGAVGHGVGLFSRTFDSQDLRVGPFAVALGSFVGLLGYGLGLGVLGREQFVGWDLVVTAGGVAVMNLFMSIPAQRAYLWASVNPNSFARTDSTHQMVN